MIKAVVFDLDGTITRPFLNFARIKLEIGGEIGRQSLLEHIGDLPREEAERALAVLERYEREAAERAELNRGAGELLSCVSRLGLKSAVITRNSDVSTARVLELLKLSFDCIITRDSGLPIKPDPAALHHLAGRWGLDPSEMLMVGDFRYDIMCGKAAGARACLVTNGGEPSDTRGADYVVDHPGEVVRIIEDLLAGAEETPRAGAGR